MCFYTKVKVVCWFLFTNLNLIILLIIIIINYITLKIIYICIYIIKVLCVHFCKYKS